jgi:hypothetical protein
MFSGVVCVGDKNAGGRCHPDPSFYFLLFLRKSITVDDRVEQVAVHVGSETVYRTIYTSEKEAKVMITAQSS